MKNQYVVLLRGINTGGLTIKMADIKRVLNRQEFSKVVTVLATGNILIETSLTEEETLSLVLGYLSVEMNRDIHGLIRTREDFFQLSIPENLAKNSVAMVLFSEKAMYLELQEMFKKEERHEDDSLLLLNTKDMLWIHQKGGTTKGFGKILSKASYKPILTSRNFNTVKKIQIAFETSF